MVKILQKTITYHIKFDKAPAPRQKNIRALDMEKLQALLWLLYILISRKKDSEIIAQRGRGNAAMRAVEKMIGKARAQEMGAINGAALSVKNPVQNYREFEKVKPLAQKPGILKSAMGRIKSSMQGSLTPSKGIAAKQPVKTPMNNRPLANNMVKMQFMQGRVRSAA
jgi:hypothetical protein